MAPNLPAIGSQTSGVQGSFEREKKEDTIKNRIQNNRNLIRCKSPLLADKYSERAVCKASPILSRPEARHSLAIDLGKFRISLQ